MPSPLPPPFLDLAYLWTQKKELDFHPPPNGKGGNSFALEEREELSSSQEEQQHFHTWLDMQVIETARTKK